MAVRKMGFEGLIYANAADGSAATTQLLYTRDMSISVDPEFGETTVRGDGSAPPINTKRVTAFEWSADFNMIEKSDDSSVELLKVAAAAGTAVAFRMKDYSGGKGFDGDVVLSCKQGKPLKGEQTTDFTAVPSIDADTPRTPVLYT